MGIRGELFSTKVSLQNRTYFFNVKENRLGDLYLNIVESKNRDSGGFERQSVIFFAEDLPEFLQGFDEALKVLEKAFREKNRGEHRKPQENRDREKGDPRFLRPERGGKAPQEKGKRVLLKTGKAKNKTGAAKPGPRKPRSVRAIRPEGPHPDRDD
ncbi:DUF3276 family protein [Treponema sp. TIM-1]|uniref:DUF3276 family protein n=1 Tax=Treponema sp. TIM-1 TaxID=2898417 RepID=UPI003980BDCA